MVFFDTIATFVQTIAGWIISATKNIAQISNGISNPVVAEIVYWLHSIVVRGVADGFAAAVLLPLAVVVTALQADFQMQVVEALRYVE